MILKYIITIAIVYFIIRSISNKPWLESKNRTHQRSKKEQDTKNQSESEFVDYEEVE